MASIFRFLGFSGNTACIMKLDDDICCVTDHFFIEQFVEMIKKNNYVGRVNEAGQGIHRWWHLGKCQDHKLNISPYSMLVDCSYANGPAYFISPYAINILARSSVYLSQSFQVELYEDVAVGKILRGFDVHPHDYDPLQAGILY
jgi:Galactosyltransferase